MAQVVQINLADDNAFYVWPGVTGPTWGSRDSYVSAETVQTRFGDHEWSQAIDAAAKEADHRGVPTVYVARNG